MACKWGATIRGVGIYPHTLENITTGADLIMLSTSSSGV